MVFKTNVGLKQASNPVVLKTSIGANEVSSQRKWI